MHWYVFFCTKSHKGTRYCQETIQFSVINIESLPPPHSIADHKASIEHQSLTSLPLGGSVSLGPGIFFCIVNPHRQILDRLIKELCSKNKHTTPAISSGGWLCIVYDIHSYLIQPVSGENWVNSAGKSRKLHFWDTSGFEITVPYQPRSWEM